MYKINSLRPIYKFASIFGMAVNFDGENAKKRQKKIKWIHFCSLMLILPLSTTFTILINVDFFFITRLDITIIEVSIMILLIYCTLSTLIQTFTKHNLWVEFFSQFKLVDCKLYFTKDVSRLILLKFILSHIFLVMYFVFDYFAWLNVDFLFYMYWLPYKLSMYTIFLSCDMICNFAKVLYDRLVFLRKKLESSYSSKFYYQQYLALSLSCYKNLRKSVELFNVLFGKRLLISIGMALIHMLEYLDILFTSSMKDIMLSNETFTLLQTSIWMVNFFTTVLF